MENHPAVINLKEFPRGFKVLSVEGVPFDLLPKEKPQEFKDLMLRYRTEEPDSLVCYMVLCIQEMDGGIAKHPSPCTLGLKMI
jgi:hypothetical protein